MARRAVVQAALDAVVSHRRQAERVLDRQAVVPARRSFDRQQASFLQTLSRTLRGRTTSPITQPSALELGKIAIEFTRRASRHMAADLASGALDTVADSVGSLRGFMGALGLGQGELQSDARTRRMIELHVSNLREMRERQMLGVGVDMGHRLQQTIDRLLIDEASLSRVITQLGENFDDEWWRVERVVRTETSLAYNAAQRDGMLALGRVHPSLMQRWTEHVDDLTGAPMDKKVAIDSVLLHGQVTRPGQRFSMPDDERTPASLAGKAWDHPPNRPNDRAVLTPWMREWGVPGWLYQGVRVNLV